MDEIYLIKCAQGGDVEAFEELIREHRDRLFRIVLGVAGNRDDAQDALQETLLQAYRALPGFRGEAAFSTWLHRVAITVTRNWIRSQVRASSLRIGARMAAGGSTCTPAPDEEISGREETRQLRKAVAALKDRYREPMLLVYYADLSYAEAADVLGVPVGTVRSRIARAKELLQADLEKSGWFGSPERSQR